MLKTPILHPQILQALGQAGHSSKILIADGNYPFATKRGPNAQMVYLNFSPGQMSVTDVLVVIANTVPIGVTSSPVVPGEVSVIITDNGAAPDTIVITVPAAKAGSGRKLFGRLGVTVP